MGIGSSAASAVQQSKAADEQRKKEAFIEQQNAENTALFNKQYYQDLTKRTEVQNMLRMLDEKQKKADTAVAARAAVTGATPEQQLAGREINRRTYADAVADIASNASQLRDSYLRDYQNNRNKYFAQRLGMQDVLSGIHANTANQWANAAVNGFQGGAQMLGAGLDQIGGGTTPTPRRVEQIEPLKAQGAGSAYIDVKPVSAQSKIDDITALHTPSALQTQIAQPVDPSVVTADLRKKLGF